MYARMIKSGICIGCIATVALANQAGLFSNIDSSQRFCWGENIGFLNWLHDIPSQGDGVTVGFDHLSGMVWAENVGWINVGSGGGPYLNDLSDSSTFGVNVNTVTGDLSGFAWGENVGWFNFATASTLSNYGQHARFDFCENRFRGYAWGENVGWVNLDDDEHFVAVNLSCSTGDVLCDGSISFHDFFMLSSNITGPDQQNSCTVFDSDDDRDVDLRDIAEFQRNFTGG
ncbi:hypothetical protein JYU10_00235 [bacterium AH-315-J04]|nr:hypothetical protein [bacterium AH-315-J04]